MTRTPELATERDDGGNQGLLPETDSREPNRIRVFADSTIRGEFKTLEDKDVVLNGLELKMRMNNYPINIYRSFGEIAMDPDLSYTLFNSN